MGKFSILILTIGIPGAGKSYWVTEYKKTHPLSYVVSTDEIRKEITGVEQCINPSQNDMIHDEARKRVKAIIEDPNNYGGSKGMGPEIIVDSTNVDVQEWIKYKQVGASVIVAKVFDVKPEEAMDHQSHRERIVPLEIVEMKWKQFKENKKYMPYIFNMIL